MGDNPENVDLCPLSAVGQGTSGYRTIQFPLQEVNFCWGEHGTSDCCVGLLLNVSLEAIVILPTK